MSECDTCGLEDPECHCYLYELSERVDRLEEELDKLTHVVKAMSEYIQEISK
jgi:hypothetical protein